MSSFSSSIRTGGYIHFMNDPGPISAWAGCNRALFHERGFIMRDVAEVGTGVLCTSEAP
ncbi:hypothetical protein HAX54_036942, partial [Datura stramonium]|nr:hypothetical protein [Datura stramonium]